MNDWREEEDERRGSAAEAPAQSAGAKLEKNRRDTPAQRWSIGASSPKEPREPARANLQQ